jgi:hypothetical protein
MSRWRGSGSQLARPSALDPHVGEGDDREPEQAEQVARMVMSSVWFSSVLHATGRRDKDEGHATRIGPLGVPVQ